MQQAQLGTAGAKRSRSRLRKLKHVSDLQTTNARLQADINALGPQVAFLRQKLAGTALTCTQLCSHEVWACLDEAT